MRRARRTTSLLYRYIKCDASELDADPRASTRPCIESERDLAYQGGELQQSLPAASHVTRQFLPAFNAIDVPALIAQAKALRA